MLGKFDLYHDDQEQSSDDQTYNDAATATQHISNAITPNFPMNEQNFMSGVKTDLNLVTEN